MLAGITLVLSFVGRGHSQVPAPTEASEAKDLSKPPQRILRADIRLSNPSWNEARQEAVGPAVVVSFSAGAAPLERVGKPLPTGAIGMAPEIAGEWKWERADRLAFYPAGGWLPPGEYRFVGGPDCWRRTASWQREPTSTVACSARRSQRVFKTATTTSTPPRQLYSSWSPRSISLSRYPSRRHGGTFRLRV